MEWHRDFIADIGMFPTKKKYYTKPMMTGEPYSLQRVHGFRTDTPCCLFIWGTKAKHTGWQGHENFEWLEPAFRLWVLARKEINVISVIMLWLLAG